MFLELFFWTYILITLLLAIRPYFPKINFTYHPIGNWAMYSQKIEHSKLQIINEENNEDLTEKSTAFLWQNFNNGKFVSFSHPEFAKKSFEEFPKFLCKKLNIKKISAKYSFFLNNNKKEYYSKGEK